MRWKPLLVGSACLLWAAGVLAGFAVAARHAGTAGRAAEAPARWPGATGLSRDPSRPTLLVFAHPRCPCTPATIEELDRLLTRAGDRVRAEVLFYDDPALGPGWARTGL